MLSSPEVDLNDGKSDFFLANLLRKRGIDSLRFLSLLLVRAVLDYTLDGGVMSSFIWRSRYFGIADIDQNNKIRDPAFVGRSFYVSCFSKWSRKTTASMYGGIRKEIGGSRFNKNDTDYFNYFFLFSCFSVLFFLFSALASRFKSTFFLTLFATQRSHKNLKRDVLRKANFKNSPILTRKSKAFRHIRRNIV